MATRTEEIGRTETGQKCKKGHFDIVQTNFAVLFLLEVTCAKRRGPSGPQRFNSVCVSVCLSVCLSVRSQTPLSSRHESGPSLFLSTGKHPVGGQLPRVFFSALPGQSSDRPNLPPHKKLSIFQLPFASIRRATSEACSALGKRRIDRSTSKRSSKKLQRATITAFFLDRSLVVVHCDRS